MVTKSCFLERERDNETNGNERDESLLCFAFLQRARAALWACVSSVEPAQHWANVGPFFQLLTASQFEKLHSIIIFLLVCHSATSHRS
jgi:hypothetical protein